MIQIKDIIINSPLPLQPHLAGNPRLCLRLLRGGNLYEETPFVTGDLQSGEWRIESSLHVPEVDVSFTLAVVVDKEGPEEIFVLETLSMPELPMRTKMKPDDRLKLTTSGSQSTKFTVHVSLQSPPSREYLETSYAAIHRMVDHDVQTRELNAIGCAYHTLFQETDSIADLEKAVSIHKEVMQLTPASHPQYTRHSSNLGIALHSRFHYNGNYTDIDQAISLFQQAVEATGYTSSEITTFLDNLGLCLTSRFERFGSLSDLDRAISIRQKSVDLTPDGHPNKVLELANLGSSFQSRFERLGALMDLERAVSLKRNAVDLTPDGQSSKPALLASLGSSIYTRFERFGSLADIDQAISLKQHAVDLTPDSHPSKPSLIYSLGGTFEARYRRLGSIEDLEQAVILNQLASDLTPDNHPTKSFILASLGNYFQARFKRLGNAADLDRAISTKQRAGDLTPDGHPNKPSVLSNLGSALQHRYEYFGDLSDLDQAITLNQLALDLTPANHPNKPSLLGNLGRSLELRFDRLGTVADIDQAIAFQQNRVDMIPDRDPEKSSSFFNLGRALQNRFFSNKVSLDIQDIENAILAFSRATTGSTGPPIQRIQSARAWARILSQLSQSPLPAFKCAISLLPLLAWVDLPLTEQHALLINASDVVDEAVAAAIQFEEYETAVEWTEQGRAIVWQNMISLRDPLDDLHRAHPELAARLNQISKELTDPTSVNSSSGVVPAEETNRRSSQLGMEWDNVVEQIRSMPNFESFLATKTFAELGSVAYEGPIIILNVHESRCDALALLSDSSKDRKASIMHIPLETFSREMAQELSQNLSSLLSSAGVLIREIQREDSEVHSLAENNAKIKEILRTLWLHVAKPIINALAYQPESSEPPRIWWCMNGPLAFLPIQAAGIYDTITVGEKLSDYVVSSYTITLATLLKRPRPTDQTDFQILTVSQPSLPGTEDEVKRIERLAGDIFVVSLSRENATAEYVLQGMSESNWIHLACHGKQNKDSSMESGFLLHDRMLELSDIIKERLPKAEFAFLSACQTATGDEKVADESVHLAAGMLFTGCRSVIATMWSIKDDDAPQVAEDVYSRMLKGGQPNSKEAARALHEAIKRLRDSGAGFLSWVPFIHIGR